MIILLVGEGRRSPPAEDKDNGCLLWSGWVWFRDGTSMMIQQRRSRERIQFIYFEVKVERKNDCYLGRRPERGRNINEI